MSISGRRIAALILLVVVSAASLEAAPPAKPKAATAGGRETVLVLVNGQKVTEADLNRAFATRQVPDDSRARLRKPFLEELIDSRLIQQFLASRKTAATKEEIDEEVNRIKNLARQSGSDPDKVLAERGYTTESLREEFALPLAWKRHINRAIPAARVKTYFDEHRAEFDGTRVHARQIYLKVPPDDEEALKAAESRLIALRKRIMENQISFEDAARENSESPSKAEGGDVGEFQYSGKMPRQFSSEAFRLKKGEISQPFRSRYGIHLCQVTDRKPGDLSLEDVRDDVLARMSQELWKETVADMRKSAKIEWKVENP